MTNSRRETWSGIGTYIVLTFAFSAVFQALIIHAGHIAAARGLYVVALMWCPALAALATCALRGRSIRSLGWSWKPKYQAWSYVIPIMYALAAYLVVWLTGLGGFPNHDFVANVAKSAGWVGLPTGLVILFYVLIAGTAGMAASTITALGEEIGWRGFLVPELSKTMSFTATALVSGVIWTAWHVPELVFADYNAGTPAWYGLTCFAVMVIGISFVFAWMRLKSGSIWTAAFLHASHNLYIQTIFTPLTVDTGKTKWVIDEFGAALAIAAVIVAILVWRRRGEVEGIESQGVQAPEGVSIGSSGAVSSQRL